MDKFKKQEWIDTLLGGFHFILNFLKNPAQFMKEIPPIPIKEAILVQLCLAVVTGSIMGLISKSFFMILWGVLIYPVVSLLTCAIGSLILFYMMSYFTKRTFDYKEVYSLIFLSSIPVYLIRTISPIVESIDILSLAISGYLLRMGLVYSYKIEKTLASKMVIGIYAIFIFGFLIEIIREIIFTKNF